jgi:hypothetical protein
MLNLKSLKVSTLVLLAVLSISSLASQPAQAQLSCAKALTNSRPVESSLISRLIFKWDNLVYKINSLREPGDLKFSSEKVDALKLLLDKGSSAEILLEEKSPSIELIVALSEVYASKYENSNISLAELKNRQDRKGQKIRIILGKYEKKANLNYEDVVSLTRDLYWATHSSRLSLLESFKSEKFRMQVIEDRIASEVLNKGIAEALVSLGIIQGEKQVSMMRKIMNTALNPFNRFSYSISVNIFFHKYLSDMMLLPLAHLNSLRLTQFKKLAPISIDDVLGGRLPEILTKMRGELKSSAQFDYAVHMLKKGIFLATSITLFNFVSFYGPGYFYLIADAIEQGHSHVILPLRSEQVIDLNLEFFRNSAESMTPSELNAYITKIKTEISESVGN